MTDFDIDLWFIEARISDGGRKKLLPAEVKDEVVIEELDDDTLLTIKLAPGDYVKFRKAQKLFCKKSDVLPGLLPQNPSIDEAKMAASIEASKMSAGTGLYSLDQFASFLAGRSTLLTPAGTPVDSSKMFGGVVLPIPSSEEGSMPSPAQVLDVKATDAVALGKSLMKDLLNIDDCCTNEQGEKPLLPVNFVSTPRGIIMDQEMVVTTNKDGELTIKPSKNRPTADKLTAGQWVAANSQILAKLAPKFSPQQIMDYLDYTRKLGDLLTQFTQASVFVLDNNHRIEVNQIADKRWNNIDCTLEFYTLKKKDDSTGSIYTPASVSAAGNSVNVSSSSSRRNQSRPRVGGGICWDFNSPEGCQYGDNCRYLHQDSNSRNQRAARFQNSTVQKPAQL
jgi:hypothetical protein